MPRLIQWLVICGWMAVPCLAHAQEEEREDLWVSAVSSSSQLPGDMATYHQHHTIDGDPSTVWSPDRTGRMNRGEWIRYLFADAVILQQIRVINGCTDPVLSESHGMIKELTATFSDGTERRLALDDTHEEQVFDVDGVVTRWIELTIRSVYGGQWRNRNVGLAEVDLMGKGGPTSDSYAIRVYNIDGVGELVINGIPIVRVHRGQDSGWRGIAEYLWKRVNRIEFRLIAETGDWSYGFQVRKNGSRFLKEECGEEGMFACDDRAPEGRVKFVSFLDIALTEAGRERALEMLAERRVNRREDVRSEELPERTLMLAADPSRPERLYLLDGKRVVWVSHDAGERWTEAIPENLELALERLLPSCEGHLLGLAEDGLYYTDDDGETWNPLRALAGEMAADLLDAGELQLAADPQDPSAFYLILDGKIRRAVDGGRRLTRVEAPARVLGLAVDPADGSLLFAVMEGEGLMVRSGEGAWRPVIEGIRGAEGLQILRTAESADEVVVALAEQAIVHSSDGGRSFTPYEEGLAWEPGETLELLARDPVDLALTLVTSQGRVFRRASGSDWDQVGQVDEVPALAEDGVSFMSLGDNELRVGTDRGVQVLDLAPMMDPVRIQAGSTRVFVPGQDLPGVRQLAVDPSSPDRLFALGSHGEMWFSDDGGRSFADLPTLGAEAWVGMAHGGGGMGLAVATDRQLCWLGGDRWIPTPLPGTGPMIAIEPDRQGLWVLRESGVIRLRGDTVEEFASPELANRLAVAGGGEAWVADGTDQIWRRVESDWLPAPRLPDTGGTLLDVVADPTTRGSVYAVKDRGLWMYDAEGERWESIAGDLFVANEDVRALALAVDPADRSLYLSLSDGRVLRSVRGGRAWRPVGEQLPVDVASLVAHGGGVYLAGAEDSGPLFRLSRVLSRERLSSRVFFETGSATLSPEGMASLGDLATKLRDGVAPLRIEGHTDNVGSDEVNQRLSIERALAVADFLSQHGLPRERITTEGLGPRKPIADNEDEEGRAQNRRVEILVVD